MSSPFASVVVPAVLAMLFVSAATPVPLVQGQDPSGFTSEAAKRAASKYTEQVAKLDEEYASKLQSIADQYIKDLEPARKSALAKPDLDEAQRVVKAQKEAQGAAAVQPAQRRGFDVVTARWGALTQWLDVTALVRAKIKDGELSLVPDQMNFTDPIDGTRKQLVVMYVRDGKTDLAIAGDGQPLNLPPPGGR